MKAKNRITIKTVNADNENLPLVIQGAIGKRSSDKLLKVIRSYELPGHEIIGAFKDDNLVGVLGICKASQLITICHLSILQSFQRQGIGTLLLDEIKKHYERHCISAETDEESIDFYVRSGFSCHAFKSQYGKLRYKCMFK